MAQTLEDFVLSLITSYYTFLIPIVLFLVLSYMGLRVGICPHGTFIVLERCGTFTRIIDGGSYVTFFERPKSVSWTFHTEDRAGGHTFQKRQMWQLSKSETIYDPPSQTLYTSDGVQIRINTVIFYRIVDPYKVVYSIADLTSAMHNAIDSSLRRIVSGIPFANIEDMRLESTLYSRLRDTLNDMAGNWGIEITRVQIQELNAPKQIREQREKLMATNMEREISVQKAQTKIEQAKLEAERARVILVEEARSKAAAREIEVSAELDRRAKLVESEELRIHKIISSFKENNVDVDPSAVLNYCMQTQYIDTLPKIFEGGAESGDRKIIFVPQQGATLLGGVPSLVSLDGGVRDVQQQVVDERNGR